MNQILVERSFGVSSSWKRAKGLGTNPSRQKVGDSADTRQWTSRRAAESRSDNEDRPLVAHSDGDRNWNARCLASSNDDTGLRHNRGDTGVSPSVRRGDPAVTSGAIGRWAHRSCTIGPLGEMGADDDGGRALPSRRRCRARLTRGLTVEGHSDS